MNIPFLDLGAAYLELKSEIDAASRAGFLPPAGISWARKSRGLKLHMPIIAASAIASVWPTDLRHCIWLSWRSVWDRGMR